MRDIKFRGQIKDKKEWVYGTLLRIPAPPQCIGEKKPDTYFIQFPDSRYTPDWNMPYSMVQAEVEAKTIGQYTGLKDKNETDIYEGDIVRQYINGKYRLGVIIYEYTGFCIDVTMNKELFHGRENILETFVEVIGNIYENKDLLKESEVE